MKKLSIFFILLLFAFVLSSCAGGGGMFGGGSSDRLTSSGGDASMSLTVKWPQDSKASVLSSAYSLKISVCTQIVSTTSTTTQYERVVPAVVFKHSAANTAETKTINGVPTGSKTVIAQAYDASGEQIGYGSQTVIILQGDNSGMTISLTLGVFPYTITSALDVAVPTENSTVPIILNMNPASGPAGSAVTLSGAAFGSYSSTSMLKVGNTAIEPTSWSNNEINFNIPDDAIDGRTSVKVSAAGEESNIVYFTVGQGIQITNINPAEGPVGTNVIISGSGFTSGGSAHPPVVTFNAKTAAVTAYTNIQIHCQVPQNATTGHVVVQANLTVSNSVEFIVTGQTGGWTALTLPSTYSNMNLKGVWCTGNPFRAYVAAVDLNDKGKILLYNGGQWAQINCSDYGYTGIFGINNGAANMKVFAIASTDSGGKIIGGGLNDTAWPDFTPFPISPPWPYRFWPYCLWVSAQNDLYVGGGTDTNQGMLSRYSGSTWLAPVGCAQQINGIWMSGTKGFAVGPYGYTRKYDIGGWQAPVLISGDPYLQAVWGNFNGTVFYAVGNNGKIYRYAAGWVEMQSGVPGESLISVWGTNEDDVYAVGTNGTIIHYDGTSWISMTSGTTNNLSSIFGFAGQYIIAVGNNGTVLKNSCNAAAGVGKVIGR